MARGVPKNGVNKGWFKKGQKFGKRNHIKKGHPSYSDPIRIKKISESRWGDKHWAYKKQGVGKSALHIFLRRRLKKPILCQNCKKMPSFDLANISQLYKRDLSDWEWLCRKCHMIKDGRIKNLKNVWKTKTPK